MLMNRHEVTAQIFNTISQALDAAATTNAELVFYTSKAVCQHRLSYSDLRLHAVATAHKLTGLGLPRGSRIGMIADTSPDFLIAFYACQYAGFCACPLPASVLVGGKQDYIDKLISMMRHAQASLILSPRSLMPCAEAVSAELCIPDMSYNDLFSLTTVAPIAPFTANENAYIQYSSGSTRYPKGVVISQKAICTNATAIIRFGLCLREDDRAFSWLPFYHDMGLVGFSLAPLFGACSVDYMSPAAFARNPALWLDLMQKNGSTITYAPSFAYDLVTRRYPVERSLDLSKLRVAGIGGDMINIDILERFATHFKPYGFNWAAFTPSYGMAEAVLAITIADHANPLRVVQFENSGRTLVSCGKPLPGIEITIIDEQSQAVAEGVEGRILVRGANIMYSYFADDLATNAVIREDGFLDTGDLGTLIEGELIVTGRHKDMILQRGRNIWPQDIEAVAEAAITTRIGAVAAIGVDDGEYEALIVLVENGAMDTEQRNDLAMAICAAISRAHGVVSQIVYVAPRWLPYTSSGKLARQQAKHKYLNEIRTGD